MTSPSVLSSPRKAPTGDAALAALSNAIRTQLFETFDSAYHWYTEDGGEMDRMADTTGTAVEVLRITFIRTFLLIRGHNNINPERFFEAYTAFVVESNELICSTKSDVNAAINMRALGSYGEIEYEIAALVQDLEAQHPELFGDSAELSLISASIEEDPHRLGMQIYHALQHSGVRDENTALLGELLRIEVK